MGNAVVWKPASSAVLPAYYIMQILKEAGMPDGVINLIPGPGPVIGPPVLNHIDLGGVHFTGSTYVFSTIWLTIGSDIRKYQSYPRIVGETGGKDFIFAHESADVDVLVSRPRARGLRVPGPEVLGRQPGLHPRQPLAAGEGADARRDRDDQGRRCLRLQQLHERGDRPDRLQDDHRVHRVREERSQHGDPLRREATTTARATSSSPPSSKPGTRTPS